MLRPVVLTQYRRVTDGRTDGQTDGIAVASTVLATRRAVKMGNVALTTLIFGVFLNGRVALAMLNLCAKFEDSSCNFIRSKDMKTNI